jgi:hypothetical protein
MHVKTGDREWIMGYGVWGKTSKIESNDEEFTKIIFCRLHITTPFVTHPSPELVSGRSSLVLLASVFSSPNCL